MGERDGKVWVHRYERELRSSFLLVVSALPATFDVEYYNSPI